MTTDKTKPTYAKGYKQCKYEGKNCLEHRAKYQAKYGPLPPNTDIHHKNGNKLDNRLRNLQAIDHAEHARLHAARQPRDLRGRFDRVSNNSVSNL